MEIFILAWFGLIFGSFTDALTWRIHAQAMQTKTKKQTENYSMMTGRSMCESCHHILGPLDLVPLFSWLFLRGKCRYCGHKISWQSPVIEIVMALLFAALFIFWPGDLLESRELITFGAWLVYTVSFVAMAVYDLRWMIVPNRIVLPVIGLAVVFTAVDAVLLGGGAERVREAVLGLFVGGGLFFVLFQASNGRWIGGGDVKLGFLLGIILGPLKALVALYASFNLAALIILPLMLLGKVGRKSHVPFGPFLIAATIFSLLFGQHIADWYNNVFLFGFLS